MAQGAMSLAQGGDMMLAQGGGVATRDTHKHWLLVESVWPTGWRCHCLSLTPMSTNSNIVFT